MMELQAIVNELGLSVLSGAERLPSVATGVGYASDLLSCVMAAAPHHGVWVTLQAHANVVAVAALLDLAAVILTDGAQPDAETLDRARKEGVVVLATRQTTFEVVGRLWALGVRAPAAN